MSFVCANCMEEFDRDKLTSCGGFVFYCKECMKKEVGKGDFEQQYFGMAKLRERLFKNK